MAMSWRIIAIAVLIAVLAVLFGAQVVARGRKTGGGSVGRTPVVPGGLQCKSCGRSLKQDQLLGPASSPRCPHCGGTVELEE